MSKSAYIILAIVLSIFQVWTDASFAFGFFVMAYAAGSVVYNIYYAWYWRKTKQRIFIYAATVALRIAIVVIYVLTLFYNITSLSIYFRGVLLFIMITFDFLTFKMSLIEMLDPGELAQQKIGQLEHEIKGKLQTINILEANNKLFREQIEEMREAAQVLLVSHAKLEGRNVELQQGLSKIFEEKMALELKIHELENNE